MLLFITRLEILSLIANCVIIFILKVWKNYKI